LRTRQRRNVARCHEPRSDGRASDPTIVPTCEILAPEMAVETLTKPGNPNLVAVRQDFTGAFSGRALLIFPERGSLELMRAILGRQLAAHDILDRQCHSQQLVDNARQYTEKEPQDVAAGGDPAESTAHL
jgi:hypothetical protein